MNQAGLHQGELIGLIAGSGGLPHAVAEGVRSRGNRLAVFGLKGLADEGLSSGAERYYSIEVGKLGKLVKSILECGVRSVVFAGKVSKTLLYGLNIVPYLRAVKLLYSLKDRKDDTIMLALLDELGKEGIQVLETTAFTGHLLATEGCMSRKKPTAGQEADIAFGARMAREMGRLDIGQTVVVRNRAVMAVEAIEGTDEAIRRGGALCREGAVVVKICKPQQDLRFDLPATGLRTIETMRSVEAACLAIEAGRTIVIERESVLNAANAAGIAIVALDQDGKAAEKA